jgi:heme/copper-type cytochrome/quinol oxidase subunit 4
MAFYRPDPNSSKRWIFNYGHLGVGTLAMILSVVAILLVTDLELARLDKDVTMGLAISFACCYVALHISATLVSIMTLGTKSKQEMLTLLLLATAFVIGLALTGAMIYCIADAGSKSHDDHKK